MIASAFSKAFGGGVLAALAAAASGLADGEWSTKDTLIVIGAFIGGALGVYRIRNTEVVKTGPGTEPKVTELVATTGERVGQLVADTGAAAGGIVAGTTGVVGGLLNATLGKLLPGGKRRL